MTMMAEESIHSVLTDDLKRYIDQRDCIVESKIKIWIMSSVLAQILTLLPIIFFLGGIYQNVNSSFELLKKQSLMNDTIVLRIQGIEERQREVRAWAKTKGFLPFTPDVPTTPIK